MAKQKLELTWIGKEVRPLLEPRILLEDQALGHHAAQRVSEARNPDIAHSLAALRRAAQMARELAVRTNTAIVVSRDGKLVRITADELRRKGVR